MENLEGRREGKRLDVDNVGWLLRGWLFRRGSGVIFCGDSVGMVDAQCMFYEDDEDPLTTRVGGRYC